MYLLYVCLLAPLIQNGHALIPEEADLSPLSNYDAADELDKEHEIWNRGSDDDVGIVIYEHVSKALLESICEHSNALVYVKEEDVTVDCSTFQKDDLLEEHNLAKREINDEIGSGDGSFNIYGGVEEDSDKDDTIQLPQSGSTHETHQAMLAENINTSQEDNETDEESEQTEETETKTEPASADDGGEAAAIAIEPVDVKNEAPSADSEQSDTANRQTTGMVEEDQENKESEAENQDAEIEDVPLNENTNVVDETQKASYESEVDNQDTKPATSQEMEHHHDSEDAAVDNATQEASTDYEVESQEDDTAPPQETEHHHHDSEDMVDSAPQEVSPDPGVENQEENAVATQETEHHHHDNEDTTVDNATQEASTDSEVESQEENTVQPQETEHHHHDGEDAVDNAAQENSEVEDQEGTVPSQDQEHPHCHNHTTADSATEDVSTDSNVENREGNPIPPGGMEHQHNGEHTTIFNVREDSQQSEVEKQGNKVPSQDTEHHHVHEHVPPQKPEDAPSNTAVQKSDDKENKLKDAGKGRSSLDAPTGNVGNKDTSVKTDESTQNPKKAGNNDSTILVVLFVAVVAVGALAFAYNFIQKRKQRPADPESVERAPSIKRSLQNLTKAENEPETKPLMNNSKEVEMVNMKMDNTKDSVKENGESIP